MKKRILSILALAVLFASCKESNKSESDFEIWGVDISKHQSAIDWKRIHNKNKPHFVFLKATEGTLITDPTYNSHAKELEDTDILWGAYHFFGHRTPGRDQAKHFIKTANLKKGNLIPVLDIEKHRFMTDPKKSVKEAKEFCKEIKSHYGVYPIIYCSTLFYEQYLKADFKPSRYTLWIADYRGNPTDLEWQFWQHTDSHTLKGIKGNVDRNVFSGSVDDLKKHLLR